MADPQTVNTGLSVPTRGSDVGTWDLPVNGDFTAIDGFFGGIQAISVSSSPVTLTVPAGFTATPSGGPTQSQNAVLRFTGALTTNVQITLSMPGYMIIENLTVGAFVLTFRAVGSGEIIAVEAGQQQYIFNDGTNVRFVGLPQIGSYLDVCDSVVPPWITACTKPPYLNCDGSTFSAVTYPYLNGKLSGTTLPDLRGIARYTLNQGTGRLTSAGSGLDGNTRFSIKTTQTVTLGTPNLPAYTPTGSGNLTSLAATISIGSTSGGGNAITTGGTSTSGSLPVVPGTVSGAVTVTMNPQGGTSTPFGTVGPGTISGITLIRAG